jgi:hypothetical protein
MCVVVVTNALVTTTLIFPIAMGKIKDNAHRFVN